MLVALGHIEKNPADSTLVRGYKVDETLAGKALSNEVLLTLRLIARCSKPLPRKKTT